VNHGTTAAGLPRETGGSFTAASMRPAPEPDRAGAERLQKLIAAAGVCSRRRAEELLRQGRVRLNGRTASLGERANPDQDQISIDGCPLNPRPASLTLLLHKPVGVLSTCHDPQGRPTVLDLLPPDLRRGQGLHPVGRLDADSRGALLLSNDGDLTLRLTHPRFGHPRTYRIWVAGHPEPTTLQRWAAGIPLDAHPCQPVQIRPLGARGANSKLELVMREGRYRQIRRTAELLGHPVLDLQRVAIGPLRLADLAEGHWRRVTPGNVLGPD